MQEEVARHQHVISYYNEHVQHKLNDFIEVNPRIEAAWQTLQHFAPPPAGQYFRDWVRDWWHHL